MPMDIANNCLQGGQEVKTSAQKRKAEDFFINVDHVSC